MKSSVDETVKLNHHDAVLDGLLVKDIKIYPYLNYRYIWLKTDISISNKNASYVLRNPNEQTLRSM